MRAFIYISVLQSFVCMHLYGSVCCPCLSVYVSFFLFISFFSPLSSLFLLFPSFLFFLMFCGLFFHSPLWSYLVFHLLHYFLFFPFRFFSLHSIHLIFPISLSFLLSTFSFPLSSSSRQFLYITPFSSFLSSFSFAMLPLSLHLLSNAARLSSPRLPALSAIQNIPGHHTQCS